ncbi:MAG: cytochrome P450 [Proteobacteria bacterium]|nr:cytochrome P450 [Pseudomonadota bacterium]
MSASATFAQPAHPAIDFDPSAVELFTEDRWEAPFRQLRAEAPIHYVPESRFGPYWSVATYKPIVHIESLPKIFSSSFEYGGITIAGRNDMRRPEERRAPMFIAMDPPRHTAQRRAVAPAFGPAEVQAMMGDVRARTAAVLDSLPLGETFDWVQKVSIELTTGMLARLFDFPWEERHRLTEWSDVAGDVEMVTREDGPVKHNAKMDEMGYAFAALWQQRLANPGKDLISVMLQSEAMNHMDPLEFLGNLMLLVVGGNDTTRNSMSAFAYGLDLFPDQRARLEADPGMIPNAVQELIRWQSPLAHMRRTLTEDAVVDGVAMKEGEAVVLWYLSANRDETVFADPDKVILDRENARRHLAFGYGIHRCVGARVAELQLVVLLEEMAKRRLRANVVGQPGRVHSCFVHGYTSLPVELSRY